MNAVTRVRIAAGIPEGARLILVGMGDEGAGKFEFDDARGTIYVVTTHADGSLTTTTETYQP